ncbi:CMRF35-like molecule 3 [Simochromis diagramma]|uniref:CMRF35-like molecule 3 n=1 Tax=Simochromis diagramma TaxID=43689 RepID=UPI001A7F0FD7|nr:CMRF35-like molecule 3 [Simochromis diagramma]
MVKISGCAFILSALNIVEIMTLNVQGEIGGKVSFTCSNWNIWFHVTTNNKYLCESPCSDKTHIIITAAPGKTTHQNRVILNNKGNDLLVTFNNLKLVDSKKYYCGVERLGSDPLIEVNLKVVHGPKKPAKTVTAGSTVSFAVLNRTTMPSSHLDIITNLSVLSYITPTTPPIQKDGIVPYLILGIIAITVMIVLMVMLKFMQTLKKKMEIVSPQEAAHVDFTYDETGPEDQQTARPTVLSASLTRMNADFDSESLYAYYLQDSQSAVINDSLYSFAQLLKHKTEHNEQKSNSIYSLVYLPQAT